MVKLRYLTLKSQESIVPLYEANVSSSLSRTSLKSHSSEYSEINDALSKWYLLACSKNVYPAGSQLIKRSKEIAVQLGKPEFKGTNGSLEKVL